MGKTLTLDALREQIETKYGPFVVELGKGKSVRLLPVLRLPQERRARVSGVLKTISDTEGSDLNALVEQLKAAIVSVCETDAEGDALLEAIGDDGQMIQELFSQYQEATGLGDPAPSES
jgi:Mycobacteriophage tail assembly protein